VITVSKKNLISVSYYAPTVIGKHTRERGKNMWITDNYVEILLIITTISLAVYFTFFYDKDNPPIKKPRKKPTPKKPRSK